MDEFSLAKMPALSDFTTKAFGENWHEVGGWRTIKPGARMVTKKELAAVIKEWRAAIKVWEKEKA